MTWKRKLQKGSVILKFTAQRGYQWLNMPFLGVITAGVVAPYVQQYYPNIAMWQIAIGCIILMFLIGWLDKKLRLLHTEQSYATEMNPLMMQGLKGELKKMNREQD